MAKRRSDGRKSDESVVLSIRLSKNLVNRLDKLAQREVRTRANLIQFLLTKGVEAQQK